MVCQICGQKTATTHFKRTVNGRSAELHVCKECAEKQGVHFLGSHSLAVNNLFSGFLADPILRETDHTVRCGTCGRSFRDIVQSGNVGCADCYVTFFEQLQPSIQRIHGKTAHIGKVAVNGSRQSHRERELQLLKTELSEALAEQKYERCAQLRDQIKELEGESDE